jgi:prophage regulatory protein
MPVPVTENPISIIRLPQVKARTGLSRSTIYAKTAAGEFPSAIDLGPRAVGWIESEVEQWLNDRIALSRGRGGAQ